jgi:ATP-dependent helicase/nuclease subunit A
MAAFEGIAAELRRTICLQAQASDPAASAWVSANAGTGKTHVLTTRVLRLLLSGTPPDRILCLTYTKAAAAEMSQRVFQRLAGWVTLGEEMLGQTLAQLLDRPASAEELLRARQLFAQAIETPGGFKVQTIHAFCERLLQRFPLEAEVPPNFAILDEETGRALQRQAIDEVLADAARNPGGEIGGALQRAVAYAVDDRFDDLLRDTLAKRDWLDASIRLDSEVEGDFVAAEAFYRRAFGIGAETTLADLDASLAALLSDEYLRRAQDVLASGSARDIEAAARVAAVRTAPSAAQKFDALCDLFLTGRGEPRRALITNGLAAAHPDVAAVLGRAQDRFVPLHTERGHLAVVESTLALLRLGHAVTQRYSLLKARRAALDFDDLIRKAASLLGHHASAEWVLYKLDGGLDHILVDEAQDTSSTQWNVIEALAREFFSGAGAREDVVRTLFAVGDEKQSIYGFQGARPEMFAGVGKRIAKLAQASGMEWRHVPLTLSFRSVQPVLSAVDAVFADRSRMPGISAPSTTVRHIAMRTGQAGLVEIWDTEKSDDVEPASVWAPLDDEPASSPVVRLAARIAGTIKHWLDAGELLVSENRPVRAGDILILVRKRRPFADAVVAALKVRGVPVAGADRIALADQIAIQDLMAVGDFILLPEDDLVLATLLKSPFFDLDDDDLLVIAPGRKGSLWSALLAAADTSPAFKRAAETLKRWRARADYAPPFEFYAELLDRDGGRARLLERLGPEAADPIDEFLDLALKYDDGAAPSLQGFLDWMRANDITIKRDMEHGRGEVRVMTVHGAKGLEAPIVFLPDTCTARSGERPGGLLALRDAERQPHVPEPFCWPVKGTSRLSGVQAARQASLSREAEERNRLLYVALTRARDRLYIAGFEGANGRDRGCWYNQIDEALAGVLATSRDWQDYPVRRLEARQEAEPDKPKASPVDRLAAQSLPEWAKRPAPRERDLVLPLAPSRLAPLETDAEGDPVDVPRSKQPLAEPPSPGPAVLVEGHRFLRGTITHALLQYLPDLDASRWENAAKRFVTARGPGLSERTRASIVAETLAVLRDPAFAPLFGPDSVSEVPIVAEIQPPDGVGHRFRLTGQIDRLVRLGHEVLIVDYKTNRPPPLHVRDVADTYTLQLAAYGLAVGQIFGSVKVKAALLWTDGPRIMEIPAEVLDAAQARLFTLDRANLDAGGGGT